MKFHATTIVGLIHNGRAAMAGDGQVTFDETVMKTKAVKIRKIYDGKILAGFAGAVADAMALYDLLDKKIEEHDGNLPRAAVELAKEWRTDRTLQRLEAVIAVTDNKHIFLISGNGEVIEPDDGLLAIGSGGSYALAAARALLFANPGMTADKVVRKALEIAADICVFTNKNIKVETLK
ncbi:MAG: ATP-dependent protease subunit HslV [Candidatus Zixiibacteriota bacterium]|nr:MAG: ATP-dependent protease subunit HslV [candidate division Zixibacteria bacterium]